MKPKAYFIDIDGTLTKGHSDQKMNYNDIRSIKAAARDGAYIILSSGRSADDMLKVWEQIDIPSSDKTKYLVANNGAYIFSPRTNKVLKEDYIDKKTFNELTKYLWDRGFAFKNASLNEYCTNQKGMMVNILKKVTIVHNNLDSWEYNQISARKIGVISSISKRKVIKIANEIEQKFPKLIVTISGPGLYIEINKLGTSKGEAIKFFAEKLNIDIKDTVHIGDSMNDYSGIQVAGIGIAMKNGMKKIKKTADYVTDSVKKAGVSKAIDSLRFEKND